ncbi:MAG: orotidine-5'-phosphate decarboxylase [Candidatus Shapirobacteria bacterium]|nr:orotidine-5'-phosphate decarboxylase [Candidatus Shapirobacteria bacterium]
MIERLSNYEQSSPMITKIRQRWFEIDAMSGVGLDPVVEKIPQEVWNQVGKGNIADGITFFNQKIIDATASQTVDYKINANFYSGEQGRRALKNTFDYLKKTHPEILRVCDGKFADVGHTADHLAAEIFEELDADAVLLNPYLGSDAIKPFTKYKDKLVILCVNTSNPSADETQNIPLADGTPYWKFILRKSLEEWGNNNIIPVLSATHPENLIGIRSLVGQLPILLAGVGSQGGDLNQSVPQCLDKNGYGLMISASRAILYPERQPGESFPDASRRAITDLKNNINQAKTLSHG